MFRITMDEKQFNGILKFLQAARTSQDDHELPVYAVRAYGLFVKKNFQARGTVFGKKWQNISEGTQQVRKDRGQSVLAPPLIPSGQERGSLYDIAAHQLTRLATETGSKEFTDRRYRSGKDSDGPTTVRIMIQPQHATLTVFGAKAAHMFGDKSKTPIGYGGFATAGLKKRMRASANRYGANYLPPRPFWGVTLDMFETMETAVVGAWFRRWALTAEGSGSGRVNYNVAGMRNLEWRAL